MVYVGVEGNGTFYAAHLSVEAETQECLSCWTVSADPTWTGPMRPEVCPCTFHVPWGHPRNPRCGRSPWARRHGSRVRVHVATRVTGPLSRERLGTPMGVPPHATCAHQGT